MNNYTLDKTDIEILSRLQKQGRIAIVELAKQVHLTTTPCAERVKRLEKLGIIANYRAIIDPGKVDKSLVIFIHVRLDQSSMTVFERFEQDVALVDEIEESYSLTGEFDAMLKVRVSNMNQYQLFMAKQLPKLSGVIQTRSEVVIKPIKLNSGISLKT